MLFLVVKLYFSYQVQGHIEETLYYIAKDGSTHTTHESLGEANEAWNLDNLRYIGRDGNYYSTSEDLEAANDAWLEVNCLPNLEIILSK